MNWQSLDGEQALLRLDAASGHKPQLLFKHSPRCATSHLAKARLDAAAQELLRHFDLYMVDVIAQRPLSQAIAQHWHEHHESPQVLLIVQGHCVFAASHIDILPDELIEQARIISSANPIS